VRACMDARSCIGMFEEELPDVAIVDGILPGTDDLWLVEHLRRTFPSAPLIMLSGIADPAFMQGALWAGIAHYLLKPCRLRDLEAAVFELAQSAGRSSLAADAAMRIEKRGR
jgi:YesN/AraC family two-component response regulator